MSPLHAEPPPHRAPGHEEPISPESRHWLGQHHEGSLSYMSGCGPRSVVTSYALVGDRILLQVPDYNEIAHYAPGAQVSLDVADDPAPPVVSQTGRVIQEIRVTGTAELESNPGDHRSEAAVFDESWPPGIRTNLVTLPLELLEVSERAPA